MVALNTELKTNNNLERQIEDMDLNAKLKEDIMALNVELGTNNDSERQTKDMALNAKLIM